jgi:hypothetical protein
MLSNFNANQLPGAKSIFIDVARMFREILTNSPAYGKCAMILIFGVNIGS